MNEQDFIQELFNALSSYNRTILEKLYDVILKHDYMDLNLDRFTFEKEKDRIRISDDVYDNDIGSVVMRKDEFLKALSKLIH
ncbi:hypothetical protein PYS58_01115 [Chryseobacterium indologenes]|uniref:hypothetical protein n=1 Tax=Chryseobacterium TaxID=59732 RepID=UPI0016244027|nr:MULTISPECIES: hypothetical protein [Chryseobacterium]MDM1555176.1 hypothetical protein [Chryseobacterium indologenes]WET49736.1 hypothetical protein PYS58_01115 [Chryseobacterium indologenes]